MPGQVILSCSVAVMLLMSALQSLAAADQSSDASSSFVRLPASDTHYRRVRGYVEEIPEPDYHQASEAAREAFRDMKFGLRIH